MIRTDENLTGIEKASVLLMSLGADASEQIMNRLSPEERDVLVAQIAKMQSALNVSSGKSIVRDRVFEEVRDAVLMGRSTDARPFKWLETYGHEKVARMLEEERPSTIALVLSYLSPHIVASVMGQLDARTRERVARLLSDGNSANDNVAKTVDETMRNRATGSKPKSRSNEVLSTLGALGNVTSKARKSAIAAVSRPSATPRPTNQTVYSSLEELSKLPAWRTRFLLDDVDLDDLCLSLRVASDELKGAVLRSIPTATAALIQEHLQKTVQVRICEIETAQKRVLGAISRAYAEHPELAEEAKAIVE